MFVKVFLGIVFWVFMDLILLPIFLFLLVKVFTHQDLINGLLDTIKLLQISPLDVYGSFIKKEGYRNLWLVMQPLIGLFFYFIFARSQKGEGAIQPEKAGNNEYGSSRFLTPKEIDKSFMVWRYPQKIEKGGIVLGSKKEGQKHKYWLDDKKTHCLVIGATDSGKTQRIILPTIWTLAQAGESMIITDPKGELYGYSASYLEKQGYKVVMLDLRSPGKSRNFWNPIAPVNEAVNAGDIGLASEKAWDIANMLVYQKPIGNSDPIWPDGEESTIAALLLAVAMEATKESQKNIASVYQTLGELGPPDEDGNIPLLQYFYDILLRNHPARAAFTTANLAPYKTRASFFTGVSAKLRLWADPGVSYLTSIQDHNLADIGMEKVSVFLIVPDEKKTRNFLATLYIEQVYQTLITQADRLGGELPVRVNFLLEEFGNLPQIADFDTKITAVRSRNIRFVVVLQGLDQLRAVYKEKANIISGNCRTWIYLLTADFETAKVISQKTGQYTIQTESYSSSNRQYDTSTGLSHGMTGRALLMPDEILRFSKLYPGKVLVLQAGNYPAILNAPFLSDTSAGKDLSVGFETKSEPDRKELNTDIWIPGGGQSEAKLNETEDDELDII